jgi:hypothetical protein
MYLEYNKVKKLNTTSTPLSSSIINLYWRIKAPHTKVLEWISELTGVGADIDKGSQSMNGT